MSYQLKNFVERHYKLKVSFQKRVVRSLKVISHRTCWISFDQPIHATPGQFVMIWLPGKGEKPYSIASLDPFGILVVDVGPFSHALHHLKAGEAVWIKGPLGH